MIILMKCLNEEKMVKKVLSDFHEEEWVERVIVIDGGSTDYTVPVLKEFDKVEAYVHPWLDWYHDMEVIQSNIAMSYIPNGEWFFILDFDERMNDKLRKALRDFDPMYFGNTDAIQIARKTIDVVRYPDSYYAALGEDGWPIESHQIGQWPDYQCRLIRRNPKLHWINSPHHVMAGVDVMAKMDESCFILHYEKEDLRDRERIEKKWLRAQARRKQLGLTADVFETKIKPELGKYADSTYWGN